MGRLRWLHVVILAGTLALAGSAGVASAQSLPANAGNLDDGGPVDPGDVLAVRNATTWLPPASELVDADCAATADTPELVERNGLVLIRGWGHWSCSPALPGSYVEVCLDAVVPAVSCNEKLVPPPRDSISLPVDFPCAPGIYLTMTSGANPVDTNRSNDVAHSRQALVVGPLDCTYLDAP